MSDLLDVYATRDDEEGEDGSEERPRPSRKKRPRVSGAGYESDENEDDDEDSDEEDSSEEDEEDNEEEMRKVTLRSILSLIFRLPKGLSVN